MFGLACLAFASTTIAHHSQGMFVETPLWVTGTIVRYRPVDPHAMIELRETQPGSPGRFVHGQVFVMPDGSMLLWGPYGVIDNCVRKGDTARTWRTFLDGDPLAHRSWCESMLATGRVHLTPRAFIDDVNRGLATACR